MVMIIIMKMKKVKLTLFYQFKHPSLCCPHHCRHRPTTSYCVPKFWVSLSPCKMEEMAYFSAYQHTVQFQAMRMGADQNPIANLAVTFSKKIIRAANKRTCREDVAVLSLGKTWTGLLDFKTLPPQWITREYLVSALRLGSRTYFL